LLLFARHPAENGNRQHSQHAAEQCVAHFLDASPIFTSLSSLSSSDFQLTRLIEDISFIFRFIAFILFSADARRHFAPTRCPGDIAWRRFPAASAPPSYHARFHPYGDNIHAFPLR